MRALALLLLVAAPANAGKLKATFECKKILKDQSEADIGGEGYRIDAVRIQCTLSSKTHALLEATAIIKPVWHNPAGVLQPSRERRGEPITEGPPFQYIFTLDRGLDWELCAKDISFPVTVTDDNGAVVFAATKSYAQDCRPIPVSPPPPKVTKPEPSRWDSDADKTIPAGARDLAQQFVDAVVDSDPPTLATLASSGVKKGKKTLKGKDVYDITAATGIAPGKSCDESGKNCSWGPWAVIVKSPKEFWIYSTNDSGYGAFACAVFTKKGDAWLWTAVKTYDTGEP